MVIEKRGKKGKISKEKERDFNSFFNILRNNIQKENHIHWEDNENITKELLNYLKESKRNWNDIILIGNTFVEMAYINAIDSLKNNDSNTEILKKTLSIQRERNKENSYINGDLMLLISSYHGKPLNDINLDISKSKLISMNLKRRFSVLEKFQFKCFYCGRSPPEVKLELEHVFPKSKGGNSEEENLVPACFECNSGKRDRVLKNFSKEVWNE